MAIEPLPIRTVESPGFDDQRPGTSGLRKRVTVFQAPHYLEHFVQSIFDCLPDLNGKTLVLGGDGRFFNREAIQTIIRMAAANGVGGLLIGCGGLLSTPAVSCLIRKTGAHGGIVLSASHNPGGPDGDFGIKYDVGNGGPAPERLTDAIFARSRELSAYRIVDSPDVDIDRQGVDRVGAMEIRVIDPVTDYAALMETIFDFDRIRDLVTAPDFSMMIDTMHAITGPYAREIFENRLGAAPGTVINAIPKPDFGGQHPDPNLTHARALAAAMFGPSPPSFGAASDGDGDRNMILGPRFFVTPSDSLAALAANAELVPGYAAGIVGVARSMPTSRAVDAVAQRRKIPCYETPTGWKFFGNLLDDGRISLCGEESFGTSSDHLREKDGLWAMLFWLNILAVRGIGIAEIMREHWREFGRCYYARHDYESIDAAAAGRLIERLRARIPALAGSQLGDFTVTLADDFCYADPVDNSRSEHQGIRVVFGDDARIVFRLSGTGTAGATLRVYYERLEVRPQNQDEDVHRVLAQLYAIAESLAAIREHSGRDQPSLIT
ncbi:MAG: alpha-D-glucose phosphate-specific phosphoglucomutase [Chromatiales bacterium]|jgi:phosphoglucomutase